MEYVQENLGPPVDCAQYDGKFQKQMSFLVVNNLGIVILDPNNVYI